MSVLRQAVSAGLACLMGLGVAPGAGPFPQSTGMTVPEGDPYRAALDLRYNLEYEPAQKMLEAWLKNHPQDLRALNSLATVILHREMFRRGILESHIYGDMGAMFRAGKIPFTPGFQENLFQVLDHAQSLGEERLKKNPNDEEALYWAGAAHSTRAVFYFTLAKSYLAALREAGEARRLHTQLLKRNPNFVDAYLVIGVNDYVAGCLPWYLRVMASLVGYRGDKVRGIQEVQRVVVQGNYAKEDARLMLAVLYRREKKYAETLYVLQGLAQSYPRNFLLQREMAGIYELQGDLRAAAKVYDLLLAQYQDPPPGSPDIPAAKISYEVGQLYVRLGDVETALQRFEAAAKLPANDIYVFRAELAAAGLCLRLNRRPEAIRKYRRVAEAIPDTEEGKAARRALKNLRES